MPSQDKCRQNRSHTPQPMGRNLGPFQTTQLVWCWPWHLGQYSNSWVNSGLTLAVLSFTLKGPFLPGSVVNFVIWRNWPHWVCFLTCKRDNTHLEGVVVREKTDRGYKSTQRIWASVGNSWSLPMRTARTWPFLICIPEVLCAEGCKLLGQDKWLRLITIEKVIAHFHLSTW